jgi:hypothetical protein
MQHGLGGFSPMAAALLWSRIFTLLSSQTFNKMTRLRVVPEHSNLAETVSHCQTIIDTYFAYAIPVTYLAVLASRSASNNAAARSILLALLVVPESSWPAYTDKVGRERVPQV